MMITDRSLVLVQSKWYWELGVSAYVLCSLPCALCLGSLFLIVRCRFLLSAWSNSQRTYPSETINSGTAKCQCKLPSDFVL